MKIATAPVLRQIDFWVQLILLLTEPVLYIIGAPEDQMFLVLYTIGFWQFGVSNLVYFYQLKRQVPYHRVIYSIMAIIALLCLALGWYLSAIELLFVPLFLGPTLALIYCIYSGKLLFFHTEKTAPPSDFNKQE